MPSTSPNSIMWVGLLFRKADMETTRRQIQKKWLLATISNIMLKWLLLENDKGFAVVLLQSSNLSTTNLYVNMVFWPLSNKRIATSFINSGVRWGYFHFTWTQKPWSYDLRSYNNFEKYFSSGFNLGSWWKPAKKKTFYLNWVHSYVFTSVYFCIGKLIEYMYDDYIEIINLSCPKCEVWV